MKINVHAGHNPDGKIGCGAVGLIKESTEARKIKDEVIRQLKELGHTVNDCTVNEGANASDVLKKIVSKCNANSVDLDVSIHLNAGRNDSKGDGKNGGTEVFVYNASSKAITYAAGVADAIADLGYNKRKDSTYSTAGVKINSSLYVLRNTKAPSMLIECCFVDDKDDVELYDYKAMASAVVRGITGMQIAEKPTDNTIKEELSPSEGATSGDVKALYRVQVGAYSSKTNAQNMADKLKKAGFDAVIVNS